LLEERPANFKEKIFDRVFAVTEISKLNVDELKAFRYSMRFKYIDERQLALDCAVEEAVEEATVVAHKQGLTKGLLKTAKAMLARGYSTAEIIGITKLSSKQIKTLM
jgi:hypothetical protein